MKEKLMILRIKKILLDYQKKERLADHEFVKEIVHIILKTYNLKRFIDEIVFLKQIKMSVMHIIILLEKNLVLVLIMWFQ